MQQSKWPTRGSRVSRNGFRVLWAGIAMLPVFLLVQLARPPKAADFALLGLMIAIDLTGLGIAIRGNQIDHRDLAGYYRKVAAGEEPQPAGQATAAGSAGHGSGGKAGLAPGAARQHQAQAADMLAELEAAPRRTLRVLGLIVLSCVFVWAAAISFFLAVTGPRLNVAGFAATLLFLALCVWSAVTAGRRQIAEHRRRHALRS